MRKNITGRLFFVALFALLLSLFAVIPASAHVAVHATSSHAHSMLSTDKKKKPHHTPGDGIRILESPIRQNDIDTPTTFLVVGSSLTPRGIYDINLDSFNLDRCDAAVILGATEDGSPSVIPFDTGEDGLVDNTILPAILTGDGTADIKADTEGRFTFTVAILNCVGTKQGAGSYSISVVNDARSGERYEAHVNVNAA